MGFTSHELGKDPRMARVRGAGQTPTVRLDRPRRALRSCLSPQSVVGSGSWQRVNTQMAVRSPRYAVFDLAEGKSYVFRVLSVNKHGLSEPSEITSPVQAQDTMGELSGRAAGTRAGPPGQGGGAG